MQQPVVESATDQPGPRPVSCLAWLWLAFRIAAAGAILLAGGLAHLMGLLPNALVLLLIGMVPVTILHRIVVRVRQGPAPNPLRRPFRREARPFLLQAVVRWVFWGLVLWTLRRTLVPFQFTPDELAFVIGLEIAAAALLAGLQLIPPRRVSWVGLGVYAIGSGFLAAEWLRVAGIPGEEPPVVIEAPFRGEWYVMQGGPTGLLNHHYPVPGQRDALDLIVLSRGRETTGDPARLESYPAFGQPYHAPVSGRIVRAEGSRPDLPIGETDSEAILGNHLVIEAGPGRFVLLAHLQEGSLQVRAGDLVRAGQFVARCGNSGNTSGPHLHIQIQDRADFESPSLRTYPMAFGNARRVRGGRIAPPPAAELRRNDRVRVEP